MTNTSKISWAVFGILIVGSATNNRILPCDGFNPAMQTLSKSQKGWLDNENDDEDDLVTREDLNRDMLGMEPKVKRKRRKGKGYTPLDNRDHLPFSVRTETPDDPYKNRFQKEKEQHLQKKKNNGLQSKRTDLDRQMLASAKRDAKKNKKGKTNRKNNSDDSKDSTAPSRLVQRRSKKKSGEDDKSMMTVLGEFELDKSTTSGDIIVLGEKEYRVEKARCQYKYAGGKRFVMVRKILEVKELTRVRNEEVLLRQYNLSSSSSATLYDEPEESE
eukprot:CAMPEP_0116153528 /NCGR_PEP_ID=MMETSP0329-20121206/21295_1 /TAXON_ID=697910 /ORGANISM="Pseudo-nitzschia arenysensis, Strain B593" /LENGTH=272 /DNA_ID=CAMNT_0003650447 /DNA_START=70 /DNA_END=888 /DNA_ORIENTATION=+